MVEKQPSSRSCFVCGRDNATGLRTQWTSDWDSGEVVSSVRLPESMNGFPGIAHGGIIAALLDEAVVRSVLVHGGGFDDLMVTAKLEVTYRCPAPTEKDLTVVGRMIRRTETRAEAEAELRLPDGTVAARARALLSRPPPAVSDRWAGERPYWRVEEP